MISWNFVAVQEHWSRTEGTELGLINHAYKLLALASGMFQIQMWAFPFVKEVVVPSVLSQEVLVAFVDGRDRLVCALSTMARCAMIL